MLKKPLFLSFLFLPNILFAYDCSKYKYDVDVDINVDYGDVKIEKSEKNLVKKLGYTEEKLSYDISSQIVVIPVNGGNCYSLRGITVDIKEDFQVIIDKRLKENSCAYDIVLKHEQDHVDVYRNIIKNNIENIKKSVSDGLKNFNTVVKKEEEGNFSKKISESDFVKNIMDDIKNKFDDENKKIDERGDTYYIWKCDDFYQEMKNNKDIVID